ncbi:hypothetical protein RND81_03G079600 [Saponaria officinalis]|uniref:Uncharacterized protein n=1 Tax=Saponaria officinalis TaxID=3572 RepID=A0AAW1M5Z8_SAPOF
MGRSYFLAFLLVFTLLCLFTTPGFGRKLIVKSKSYLLPDSLMLEEKVRTKARRLTVQLMDYEDDGNAHANEAHANVIPKVGYPNNNPAPSPENKD